MPIFEYVCLACGQRFERLEKSESAGTPECIACGSHEVKKEFSKFSPGPNSSGSCSPAPGGG